MRNQGPDYFFKKPLTIWPYQESRRTQRNTSVRKVSDFDVSFFPEGGYLIDGYDCCVAFKALGDDGGSVEITGVVKNDRDEVVDTLRTLHGGMGCLRFTAHTSERYYAECTMAGGKTERFDLPASNNLACVLRVLQTERDFTVMVQSGRPLPKGLRLLVHCRGNICYHKPWNYDYAVADLPPQRPAGRHSSNSAAGQGGQRALRASGLQSRRRTCDDRHAGAGYVETADEGHARRHGDRSRRRSCRGRFLDRGDGSRGGALGDVGQHLLDAAAHSELRGTIETPDWYFEGRDAARVTALDALLLTQGWRRYDVPAAVRGEYATPAYPLEVGQEITGRISKADCGTARRSSSRYEMRMIVPRWHYSLRRRSTRSVRAQRLRLPRQHALRAASRSSAGVLPEATVKVARDSFPEVGTLPRVPAGAAEALHRPGTALHRAARTDRHAEHPHRHGVCHASQTPRIHSTRASAGRTHVDGRADQGIGSRNHPRLHRKNAGNIDARNEYSLPTGKSSIYA